MPRALLVALTLIAGCVVPDDDPDHLGRFQVEANRTASCGDEVLLASPEQETFWVALRKTSQNTVLWNDGSDRLPLALGADGDIEGGIEVVVPVGDPSMSSCSLPRLDSIEAQLDDDGEGFSGELRHSFSPPEGDDCADRDDPVPIADELPCDVAYALEAERLP